MATLVRAAALTNFAEVARHQGLDAQRLVREADLDPRVLTHPDLRLPAVQVTSLLQRAADLSGCDTFGLRMAESRRLSDFGPVSFVIAHQPTVRDALETTMRYRNLLNEALAMHIEDAGELVVVREELVVETSESRRQAYELAVGTLFRLFRTLLGPRWQPTSVSFTHAAPKDLSVHRRLFGPSVVFGGDFNGIVSLAADLARPNPQADPALAQYARQFVENLPDQRQPSLAQEVRKTAYLLMPLGHASIAQIARAIGLNVRTLQRRLDDEGAEFSELLCEVRRDLAVRYLANPAYSMTAISRLLGYGQLSSFTRWFTTQFGEPPQRWRPPV